ncbi:MAG: DUF742 domain-containing protein [Actinomycetota bacterium]
MTEHDPSEVGESSAVRPYVITGGRTRAAKADLDVETVVETRHDVAVDDLDFERRAIAERCQEPLSIAEVASHLQLPLGVARVLACDMVDEELLVAHGTADTGDRALLERLREGIRSL